MAKVIAMCGAHGTGKSTIVNELRKDPRCICIDSVTRTQTSQAERRIDRRLKDLDQTQLNILEAIKVNAEKIRELKESLPDDKILVMDRSSFDFYAYSKNFFVKNLLTHRTMNEIEDELPKLVDFIDLFYYLPIEFNLVDDGIRNMDEDLRQGVDKVIREQLFWTGRTVELNGTLQKRMSKIHTTLLGKLKV